jgi:hypothetical protein
MEILRPRILPHREHLVQGSVLRHTRHREGNPMATELHDLSMAERSGLIRVQKRERK